ncbi:hypothetical protein P3L51_34120 [Streptomyces sp. PSRA5]|uniref:hypothetical protein n=1 Tax=Streptomyces panacea TaxID=3035064 RepID=UPI00339CE951
MDAATWGAVGLVAAGLITALAAVYGHRGQQRVTQSGVLITGYGGLVDQLQEERAQAQAKLTETELRLAQAYADLAQERADKATLERRISELTAERGELRARIAELEGHTP